MTFLPPSQARKLKNQGEVVSGVIFSQTLLRLKIFGTTKKGPVGGWNAFKKGDPVKKGSEDILPN